jgi:hypothetical protein
LLRSSTPGKAEKAGTWVGSSREGGRTPGADVWQTAQNWLERDWTAVIKAQPADDGPEQAIQKPVTLANLRLWLGGDLITTPVQVENIETATVLELMRILDYPDAFVPLVARAEPPFRLADKTRLAEELARRSIAETLNKLGIRLSNWRRRAG